ncbi:MAG: sigma-54 dependent transcriptional regulator [Bacteroidales bacterium]|nr:sigma-54 dependent transcriptional regulator [Bacteroidales bacterium]MCF8403083.1 sigma-54 dependent transcriptional regulator [Bacteroidales bacterium]
MKGKILILDDNKSVLTALEMLLQTEFDDVFTLRNPNSLVATIQQHQIDVVLLDMNFKAGINTGNEGIYWLHQIQKLDPTISVVMITAYGDVALAVKAVKEGAFDFILKPWDNNKLISTLHASLKLRKLKIENASLHKTASTLKQELNPSSQSIIGQSEPIKRVMEMVKKVAKTDANIFIAGENGTGKELVAREIHRYSKRKNEIMISVDMGAISESLFESELFGHTKGSFTDAKEDRIGKFETANKGTLFLDEIGNLPISLQAKLLTSLQNRTIVKLGSNIPVPIDIRLITATNKDLNQLVTDGLFREDLLYRVNTITIDLPPLRERGNDVLLLAEFYLHKYMMKYDKPGLKMSQRAGQKLLKYTWPGNVRELQHCIEKAVILAETNVLSVECFSLNSTNPNPKIDFQNRTIEEMEQEMILASIEKEKGNMSAVAKKLGITRPTLYKKLKKLDN